MVDKPKRYFIAHSFLSVCKAKIKNTKSGINKATAGTISISTMTAKAGGAKSGLI